VLYIVRPFGQSGPSQTGVVVGPGWIGARGAF
jgi:hypothetical protein